MFDVIEKINNVVWGWPALILLAAGVLMTVLASKPFFAKKSSLFLI